MRRYLRQSIAFWAVPDPGLADEEAPLAVDASPAVAADARLVTELEHRLLSNDDLEGIALRLLRDKDAGCIERQGKTRARFSAAAIRVDH